MPTSSFVRDPDSVLDFAWDWSAWLADGETIADAEVSVPAGLTLDSASFDTTTVTAWISGGEAGTTYTVTCRISTDQARTDDRSIHLLTKHT